MKNDNTLELLLKHILTGVDLISKVSTISSIIIEENCVCAICYSVCTETLHTECLHRFCRMCITKSLVSVCKNKCPICKHAIDSKRSLYPDHGMDVIIDAYNSFQAKVTIDAVDVVEMDGANMNLNMFSIVLKPYPQPETEIIKNSADAIKRQPNIDFRLKIPKKNMAMAKGKCSMLIKQNRS